MIKINKLQLLLLFYCLGCNPSDPGKQVIEMTYPDGSPKLIRIYYTETNELLETNFYYNSVKERERLLKDGYPNGPWMEWHKNGNVKYDKNYNNGEMDGEQKGWYMDGTIFFESTYENGLLLNRTIYNHDGSIKSTL